MSKKKQKQTLKEAFSNFQQTPEHLRILAKGLNSEDVNTLVLYSIQWLTREEIIEIYPDIDRGVKL